MELACWVGFCLHGHLALLWIRVNLIFLKITFAYFADSKRWRLIADALNDLAFCIDLTCSHTERNFFIFTVCCSSLMRAIVGVAGGGTRMAVIRHQVNFQLN
jgi:hypothetical protein